MAKIKTFFPLLKALFPDDVSSVFGDPAVSGIKKAAALWDHQPSQNICNGASISLDTAKIQRF